MKKVSGKFNKLFVMTVLLLSVISFNFTPTVFAADNDSDEIVITGNDDVVYMDMFGTLKLVSVIRDGEKLPYNRRDIGYESNYKVSLQDELSLRKLSYAAMLTSDSTNYSTSWNYAIAEYTGGWNLFPSKVHYVNYFNEDAYPKSEWVNYIRQYIKDRIGDSSTPTLIKCAWVFRYNGVEYAIVNATNIRASYNEDKSYYPQVRELSNDNTYAIYDILLLFTDTGYVQIIDGDNNIVTVNADDSDRMYHSPSLTKSTEYFDYIGCISYQYDNNGVLRTCPVYITYAGNDNPVMMCCDNNSIIVRDADKDGKPEIWLEYNRGHSWAAGMIDMEIDYYGIVKLKSKLERWK